MIVQKLSQCLADLESLGARRIEHDLVLSDTLKQGMGSSA